MYIFLLKNNFATTDVALFLKSIKKLQIFIENILGNPGFKNLQALPWLAIRAMSVTSFRLRIAGFYSCKVYKKHHENYILSGFHWFFNFSINDIRF